MKILFISKGVESDPSSIHRMEWPANELSRRGHDCHYISGIKLEWNDRCMRSSSPSAILKSILNDYDAIIVSRDASITTKTIFEITNIRDIKFVFDFDDAIYTTKKISGTNIPNPTRLYLDNILSQADYVTVGSSNLKQYAQQYNNSVTCLPTSVNTRIFGPPRSKMDSNIPTVGWMGSGPDHVDNLKIIQEPLLELSKSHEFKLKFVSALDNDVREIFRPLEEYVEVDYGFDEWVPIDRIVDEVREFDIGVCPIDNRDKFMEGKSGIKVIEKMAMKIPVVASKTSVYSNFIDHGENGLLADSTSDWIRELKRLLECPDKRTSLAEEGYQQTMNLYTIDEYVTSLERILKKIVH